MTTKKSHKLAEEVEELIQGCAKLKETWKRIPKLTLKPAIASIRDHTDILETRSSENLKGEKELLNTQTELEVLMKSYISSKEAVDKLNNKVQDMDKMDKNLTVELDALTSRIKEQEEKLRGFKGQDGSLKKQKKQLLGLKSMYDLCHISTGIKWDIKASPNEFRGCVTNNQTASFHPFCLNMESCSTDFASNYLWDQVMAQHANNWADLVDIQEN